MHRPGHRARRAVTRWAAAAAALLAITSVAVPATAGATPVPAAAEPGFCSLGGFSAAHRFVWTGAGDGHAWEDGANWNLGVPPSIGPSDDVNTDYVCIGGAADVDITDGDMYVISALDLGQRADLTVDIGSKLYINGDQSTVPSEVRRGSRLWLRGSLLGGSADVRVAGLLEWTTPSEGASATQTTSKCDLGGTPDCPARTPGRTTILVGGAMTVDGIPGGVNFAGRRTIDNFGTITLAQQGFIAADDGTAILNETNAVFRIANNRGVYEGFIIPGRPLPVFRNDGTLVKSAGSGSGVIGADFSGAGPVTVSAGTLSIAGDVVPTAQVAPAATYGTGACNGSGPCKAATVSADDPQVTAVTVPADLSAPASVTLGEQAPTGAPAGAIGQATHVELQNADSPSDAPVTITFSLNSAVLGTRNPRTLRAYQTNAKGAFRVTQPCDNAGAPPAGAASCQVSSRPLLVRGTVIGAVVVVHTLPVLADPNSRWIVT